MSIPIPFKKIDGIIRRNLKLFRKSGVLTVRPGFKIAGDWITNKPSIVVTVDKKKAGLTGKDRLPAVVEDVPVDVREATGLQRLRAQSQKQFTLVQAHGRNEFREPKWNGERTMPSGRLIQHLSSTAALKKTDPKKSVKTQLPYKPAPVPLSKRTGTMTIIAYASPDDGYTVLSKFLKETTRSLTIGLYDFTSADLLVSLNSAIDPKKIPLKMVLDHPPRNPTANQPDDVTRATIMQKNEKAIVNWALTRMDPLVTEWIYPSAYHIKVVVRDNNSMWLSSGNFNVSNQPNLAANDPKRGSLKNADRDWHVIILDTKLAKLFSAYIENDFKIATTGQGPGNEAKHFQIRKAMLAFAAASKKSKKTTPNPKTKPSTLGKQKIFKDISLSVQPILTPDRGTHTSMYVDQILALIKSAHTSVYMQTQYIHVSDRPEDKDFMLLVQALSDAHKKGLDVRVIASEFENTPQWVEKLKHFDLDQVIKIQNGVHNKGIIIDSKKVLVSSQNWSAAGVLRNRDAGLIIEHADIAKYFEAIFLDDWVNRAITKFGSYGKKG